MAVHVCFSMIMCVQHEGAEKMVADGGAGDGLVWVGDG